MSKATAPNKTAASFEIAEDAQLKCPNCDSTGIHTFYSVRDIPVHSCLLMPTREAALNYPRGDLKLGFCRGCGFVFNTLFRPEVHEYSTAYEETQGFSPTFNAFAKELAADLIRKHDLHGKTILEIGCGKGEFLVLLCQLAQNQGIGIDPGYVPQRTPEEVAPRIEFIQDFYGEKYAHLMADLICCRHTLEHIAPTLEFMRSLRKTIGDRKDTVVFFELPDVYRVLEEGAFWDIYYEHCTYFSLGSLARLFRQTGFEVTELEAVYDKQYLLLTATPAAEATSPNLQAEDDLDTMAATVEAFPAVVEKAISGWRRFVDDAVSRNEKVVLWGSGSKGVSFLSTLAIDDAIDYVVDINPYRQGHFMPSTGQEIIGPDRLPEVRPDHVIVMNPIYCDEIQKDLDRLGVKAKLHAV
ncbi:MAG: methyltransferase domain-containing protein [Planctomycetes bacterium]|nr:methyltransferase domain-containing protein [Planctomycetota bacterium]